MATAPANSERPIACKYDGYQNLLNWDVVGSIIYLYQEIIIHLLDFFIYAFNLLSIFFIIFWGLIAHFKRKKIIHLQPYGPWSFSTSRAQFLYIVIKGSHFSFQHCNVALDFYDLFICVARCLLIVFLTFGQPVFHLTNVVGYLFESIGRNGSFRAWLSPDTVDFYSKVINFLCVFIGFFRIFYDFSIETVGQFNNRLFGLRLKLLYFFIELVIILGILSFILLS